MNPLGYAARALSQARLAYGDRLTDPDAAPDAVTEPAPAVREVVCPHPHRAEPAYATAFKARFRRKAAADEGLVLERLATETARRGPWEAARHLFTP
ncbi:hypothetical protein AB0C10_37055 [Microbispora amethystogenes]|uniref:hypothetical protein n=1 Tax=Microbispora amethystogenes TaxID=1427754 RepID=UPI0033C84885